MRLENWFITNPDKSQQDVLKVSKDQNLVVRGAAGSGKTNMAIYRANQARTGLFVSKSTSPIMEQSRTTPENFENNFVIVVKTVALKKMIRYGLGELGLDKDRVTHEWSFLSRGLDISGDVFCIRVDDSNLDRNILFLKTDGVLRSFVLEKNYDAIIRGEGNYNVKAIENPMKISIDFDDWVEDKFYQAFGRRTKWFIEVQCEQKLNYGKLMIISAGFLFKKTGEVDYLIIDEGQDFSLKNYSQEFIPKAKASISIFGDTNQKIYKNESCNIEDIQDLKMIPNIGGEPTKIFKFPMLHLKYNYRVPKTIARIAQKIPISSIDLLTNNKKNDGNSDYPSFPKPIIKKCNSEEEELLYIINRIQTEDLDDVALLVPTEKQVIELYNFFSEKDIGTQVRYKIKIGLTPFGNTKFRRIDTLDFTNLDLPSILTFHSAKGTEFDNVFIPFANNENIYNRNTFYVGVTRSSSRLIITHTKELTSLLKNINPLDINKQ